MAKRLTTRVSAGASLVLGLGFAGAALATPAHADPITLTQQYNCTYDVLNVGTVGGDPAVTVTLEADLPTTAQVGDQLATDVTATVTIPDSRRDSLYGLLGVRQIDGPDAEAAAAEDGGLNTQNARNQATVSVSDGTDSGTGTIPLSFPKTDVPASGDLTVDASGAIAPITVERTGTYTISAGDFQAYIRGYDANGGYKTNITMNCTNVSDDKTFATVEVTAASSTTTSTTSTTSTSTSTSTSSTTSGPTSTSTTSTPPAPEVDDWFDEPSSLPITQDRNAFTVEGTAAHAGTVLVQLLDANKKVLKTYTWDVSEGANKRNFDFVEGTDYARVISQDCVDADGNDETVVDSGCNVEYYAPWAEISETSTSDDDSDDPGTTPETPGTVQTDALQRVSDEQGTSSAALALGGLLLAGAAAGSVVVARRRTAAQH